MILKCLSRQTKQNWSIFNFQKCHFSTDNIFPLRKHCMVSLSSTLYVSKAHKRYKDISGSSTSQLEYFALFLGLYI